MTHDELEAELRILDLAARKVAEHVEAYAKEHSTMGAWSAYRCLQSVIYDTFGAWGWIVTKDDP